MFTYDMWVEQCLNPAEEHLRSKLISRQYAAHQLENFVAAGTIAPEYRLNIVYDDAFARRAVAEIVIPGSSTPAVPCEIAQLRAICQKQAALISALVQERDGYKAAAEQHAAEIERLTATKGGMPAGELRWGV